MGGHHFIAPVPIKLPWPHFYQPGSAWSMDQGSNKNHSPVNNFTPTVTKFCVTWEGQALPHDTKFRNSRGKIVGSRTFPYWSLIHGSSWSGLIKAGPGVYGEADPMNPPECHHITITKQNQTKTVRTFMAYIVPAAVICDNGRDHSGHGFSQWEAILQQAASHNLIQYWPRHMTLYAIIVQQCFKVALIIDSTLGHISLRSLLGQLSRYPLIQTVHCFYEYTTWERVALAWH